MFSSIGWGEIAVLLAAGLIILGPDRLPGAVSWTMKSLRQVRDYATGATDQLKDELGPDFDELRKPLAELNELRGMTPRAMVTKHLLDGDDSLFTLGLDATTVDRSSTDTPPIKPVSAPVPTDPPAAPATTGDVTPQAPRRRSVTDWDAT
ncbi:Sec-independent protein translocase protein TatB [Gordonia rhizosphera]|uniref:Sec-independent protein translocase protein TatB n=1 Tax=Gordonia rhizosphera NBRC 16068 TaxID=1108045 RepID=K6W871_9ACTN|nr:Sec-independent protein translocase protein TatB [Gordonia rhizosphera]GAB88422.1 Sec-independent protein translocase protein TatB homolog [Gordonia rhizosphera NBRC 16068]